MRSVRRSGDPGVWLLEIPVERVIAVSRLVLTAVVLITLYLHPSPTPKYEEAHFILVCYLAFALAALGVELARPMSSVLLVAAYLVDLGTISFLTIFTEAAASSFFVFFTFLLLAATLRWNWRGALLTFVALMVPLILVGFRIEFGAETDKLVLRGIYLLTATAMIAYFGAFRVRSRARFAKLAAWPVAESRSDGNVSLEAPLAHAAGVLSVPRMLCIREYAEEPQRLLWYWNKGQSACETAEVSMNALIAPAPDAPVLIEQNGRCVTLRQPWGRKESPSIFIAPRVREKYHIGAAVIAPLSSKTCTGFMLALDCHDCDDLLPLSAIVAGRIGAEIDHQWMWQQMQIVAAEHERSRLARNM